MDYVPTPLQKAVRAQRLKRRMTQADLGDAIGKRQSAISMWEKGDPRALAADAVEAICQLLEIDRQNLPTIEDAVAGQVEGRLVIKACLQADCFSQTPILGSELILRPRAQKVRLRERSICTECREPLQAHCPHCRAPLGHGAVCASCGEFYVDVAQLSVEPRAWYAERLLVIRHAAQNQEAR